MVRQVWRSETRKDGEAKNAQLQLEVAVRKAKVGAIVEAFKMAWDENLSWQDELALQDISRVRIWSRIRFEFVMVQILDAMDTYTNNCEIICWGVCALQVVILHRRRHAIDALSIAGNCCGGGTRFDVTSAYNRLSQLVHSKSMITTWVCHTICISRLLSSIC